MSTAGKALRVLQAAFELDPYATAAVIQARTACNKPLDDSDIITGQDPAGYATLGALGLINTIIAICDVDSNERVAAVYDKAGAGQTLEGFQVIRVPIFHKAQPGEEPPQ